MTTKKLWQVTVYFEVLADDKDEAFLHVAASVENATEDDPIQYVDMGADIEELTTFMDEPNGAFDSQADTKEQNDE